MMLEKQHQLNSKLKYSTCTSLRGRWSMSLKELRSSSTKQRRKGAEIKSSLNFLKPNNFKSHIKFQRTI